MASALPTSHSTPPPTPRDRRPRRALRRIACASLVLTLLWMSPGAPHAVAAPTTALEVGWMPCITLAAGDDRQRAVQQLRLWMDASGKALRERRMDAATARFVEQMWESVEDFDLTELYERLPEKRKDGWRRLPVFGEQRADHYFVGRPPPGAPFQVTSGGPRDKLAEGSFVLRMRPVKNRLDPDDDDPNFLVQIGTGLVVGDVPFDRATRAQRETLDLLGGQGTVRASKRAQTLAKQHHGRLGREDLAVLSTLFEAYPYTLMLASRFIEVDDIVHAKAPAAATGAQHLKLSGRIARERFEARYAALAEHGDELGRLLRVDLRWVDAKGRNLLHAHLDTEKLRLRVECYLKDGLLVPWDREGLHVQDLLSPLADGERHSRIVARATLRAMGVTTRADNIVIHLRYRGDALRGRLESRMTSVPKISVSGAVMGMLPTSVVDFFIPGDMEQLTRDFLKTATSGNGGRGIQTVLQAGSAGPGKPATIEGSLTIEALDNALVSMGVRLAMDRIIFEDDATAEAERLARDVHAAFRKDLERYAKSSKTP